MEVKWEPRAAVAFGNIVRYRYEVAGKVSAQRLLKRVSADVARISHNPRCGPAMHDLKVVKGNYRSLVTGKIYKLIYRVETDAVYIAALLDCRRDPARLPGEVEK